MTYLKNHQTLRALRPHWIQGGLFVLATTILAGCVSENGVTKAPNSTLNNSLSSLTEVQKMPQSALGGYLAGHHARHIFDPEAASEFFSRTLELDPKNPQLLHQLLVAQVAQGKLEDALDVARRLEGQSESEPLALLVLAAGKVKVGSFAEADRILGAFPETRFYPFIRSLLSAWTIAGEGNLPEALATLEFLNSSSNFAPTHDYHAALIANLFGKETEAKSSFSRALSGARRPSIRSLLAAGAFYELHGDAEVARQLYKSFPKAGPEDTILEHALLRLENGTPGEELISTASQGFAEALFEISASLFRERAYEPSLIYCQTALFIHPNLDAARVQLADIYVAIGSHSLAVAAFQSIPASSPYSWSARIRMANSLNEAGRTEEANSELRQLALEQPQRIDPLLALADILRVEERYGDAITVYDEAIARIEPVEARHWSVFYARGMSLERNGNWEKAELDFLRALRLQPDQPLVLNYLGYSWVEQGTKLVEAKAMIQRAVEQRPNDGYIVDSLGWVLYRLQDFEAALVHLERAVELRPDDPVINDHYGDALWATGRHSEAKFQWLRALSLDPEKTLQESVQQKLKRPNPKRPLSTISSS
ncbi:MAG: tetratricopeptide repeat protein [Pseudomonadota bacterium]|nr:tetratricopeptide repeat protein [Pseudomonadota bacterium]